MLEIKITCDTTTQKQNQKALFEFKKGDYDKMKKNQTFTGNTSSISLRVMLMRSGTFLVEMSEMLKRHVSRKKNYIRKSKAVSGSPG